MPDVENEIEEENNDVLDDNDADFSAAFNEPDGESEEYEEIASDDLGDEPKEEVNEEAVIEEELPPKVEETPEPTELEIALAENVRLNHQIQSDGGRVAGMQRKINDLEHSAKQRNDPKNIKVDSEAMKLLKEDYPDIAEAMEANIAAAVSEATHVQDARFQEAMGELGALKEAESKRQVEAQVNTLKTAHSDYQEINKDDDYWNWVETQGMAVQSRATSGSAEDVINVLTSYKDSAGYKFKQSAASREEKRIKQLADSQGVASKKGSGHRTTIAKDDFSGAFNS